MENTKLCIALDHWSCQFTILDLIWRAHEVWSSVAADLWALGTAASSAPTPWFSYSTTEWFSCSFSQIIPFCYNPTNFWQKMSLLDRWHPIMVSLMGFTDILSPIYSQMLVSFNHHVDTQSGLNFSIMFNVLYARKGDLKAIQLVLKCLTAQWSLAVAIFDKSYLNIVIGMYQKTFV